MWVLSGIYGLFTLVKTIASFALLLSVTTGKIIVNIFYTVAVVGSTSYETCKNLVTVILEDFVYFISDLYNKLEVVARSIEAFVGGIVFGVLDIICFILNSVNSLFSAISNGCFKVIDNISKIYYNCIALIEGVKYFLVLLGSGIWFAITLIPLLIAYTSTLFVYYVGKFVEEGYLLIRQGVHEVHISCVSIYEFIIDVPLESAAGLMAGICIIYVIVKFHILCLQYLHMLLTSCRTSLRSIFNYYRRTTPNPPPVPQETNNVNPANNRKSLSPSRNGIDERHCVICQERQKSILLMPCRHVCLCLECSQVLRRYQRQCPICRTIVVRQMQVYV